MSTDLIVRRQIIYADNRINFWENLSSTRKALNYSSLLVGILKVPKNTIP